MNLRIKQVRKWLKLTQEEFGKRLGVTKTAISKMELGTYNVTDTMLKLICSEFSVNELWLRTGNGEMRASESVDKKYKLAADAIASGTSDLDRIIRQVLVYYFDMDDKSKKTLLAFMRKFAAIVPSEYHPYSSAPTQEELERNFPPVNYKKKDVG